MRTWPPTPAALLLAVSLAACPPAVAPPPAEPVALAVAPEDGAFTVSRAGAGYQALVAGVIVDGVERLASGAPAVASTSATDALGVAEETRLTWVFEAPAVTLTATLRRYEGFVTARLRASCEAPCPAAARVEGFSLTGRALTTAGEPRAALAHGYQSWSPTYYAAVQRSTDDEAAFAFVGNNDNHLLTDARLSWWVSAMPLGAEGVAAGALTAQAWKTRVLTWRRDGVQVRLLNGGTGDSKPLTEAGVESETFFFTAAPGLTEALGRYGRAVATLTPPPPEPFVPRGWNSWNTLFEAVSEASVLANADALAPLEGLAANLVQVDDGWQRQWGDWHANTKFPSGLDGLSATLEGKGRHLGLWLAPFFVDRTAATAVAHPEWFVRDEAGAQRTFTEFFTGHTFLVLDGSHPVARAWLGAEVQRALDAGVRYLKLDFLFAGAWEGARAADVTSLEAFHLVLRDLEARARAKGAYVVACGAPVLPSAGVAHALRTGEDIAARGSPYTLAWVKNASRNVAARWFVAPFVQSDPDTLLVRGLPPGLRRLHATTTLLAGRLLALGDDLPSLSAEERAFLARAVALPSVASLQGEGFVPLDAPGRPRPTTLSKAEALVSPESYDVPAVWAARTSQGALVGLLNWGEAPATLQVDLATLGLAETAQVDELWEGLPLTRAGTVVTVTVPAYDAAYLHAR